MIATGQRRTGAWPWKTMRDRPGFLRGLRIGFRWSIECSIGESASGRGERCACFCTFRREGNAWAQGYR